MSPPSLGRTQLQPVSPLVKLRTARQGNTAVALSVCLSAGQVLSSSLPLVDLRVSRVESKLCLPDGTVLYVRAVLSAASPGSREVVG